MVRDPGADSGVVRWVSLPKLAMYQQTLTELADAHSSK